MRHTLLIAFVAVVSMSFNSGCERPEDPMLKVLEASSTSTRIDDLARTMDFVFSERQFDQIEFNNKVSDGLNRWANYSQEKFEGSDWQPDGSISDMLSNFDSLEVVQRLDESSYLTTDASYLQTAVWCQQIANRVDEKSTLSQFEFYRLLADDFEPEDGEEAPIDRLIEKLNPAVEGDDSKRLASALKLFDWVTRNILLVDPVDYDPENLDELKLVDGDTPSASGISELGGRRHPWETLIFARGDYVEKAKLFMLLCQQLELDTVMLATTENEATTPWAVGIPVGDELYLFDTRLGLPVPGKTPGSIATLSELRGDESLLSSLDLTVKESLADDTKYWVKNDDLDSLKGLVYWLPESVSRRMAVLEDSLVGDQRLLLTRRPESMIASLPKIENVNYEPWNVSLKTHQFRAVLRESLPKAMTDDALAQKLSWYPTEEEYVLRFPIYRTSRTRFFRGKFERPRGKRSRDSIESFGILMYDDDTINGLSSDRNLQMQIGIRNPAKDMPAQEFARQIQSRQSQMRLVRRDAGFFMCQAHFDNGSVSTTATWMPKLLNEDDVERWAPGLAYLYSRALEYRHQYDDAIEYLQEEGPQQHGNLLRARYLRNKVEEVFADKPASDSEAQ
jgi:hypothetical protein